ncbi:heparinase II/III family protein [Gracilibacillus alcaliphilus]|uniref:heparinase II/III family protein n=1 Tax=Gracilibacillus alcaliphilus TaxID=1401441 RepID=UPI001EF82661|nr:heparinase II/III family protein [Gracilibacillus alcaliphilus]MBM7675700.1 hypothetical protein [Gracilibacillus alcaliphilus]
MRQTDHVNNLWEAMKKDQQKEMIDHLKKQAAYFLSHSSSQTSFQTFRQFQTTGERSTFEQLYFERRKRLTTFGLLSYIDPDNALFLTPLENEIWQVCQEFTWCLPAHLDQQMEGQSYEAYQQSNTLKYTIDLFAAETAFSLAEIIYLLEERLDSFLIDQTKIEIDRRVLRNFINNGPFHWERADHNWASVCAGSVGAAAIYMLEDQNQLDMVLERVVCSMEHYLNGFAADGACTEGYSYWQYGFGYFIYFFDLLERATGDIHEFFDSDKVRKIAQFQQHIFLAGNHVINFSDAAPFAKPMLGFTHYLHKKFPEIHIPMKEAGQREIVDHCGRWAPAFRELQWYESEWQGTGWPDTSALFEQSSVFTSRITHNGHTYAFAAKGGHNNEPHNHNDIGHFVLFGGGEVFLKDLGAGQYNKAYFSDKRYNFICNSGKGHSIPIINGQTQLHGERYQAIIQQAEGFSDKEIFQLNMTKAYSDSTLIHFDRLFVLEKSQLPVLTLTDRFHFTTKPSSVIENFILQDMAYDIGNNHIVLKGEEQSLKISFGSSIKPRITRKTFINHQGEEEAFLQLQITLQKINIEMETTIVFEFCSCHS